MNTVKRRTTYSIDVDGVECELPYGPDDCHNGVLTKTLPNGNRVIGFLCHDQDCQNPCEDDGVGYIRSLNNRHINRIDRDEAVALLESDPDVIPLSYFEHGRCMWAVKGALDNTPDFCWDGTSFAGVWIPDDCTRNSCPVKPAKKGKKVIGGERRQWFEKQAESACEQYTSWANGDCYGHTVVVCDQDGAMLSDDACWGYVGTEYAEERLQEEFNDACERAAK